MLCDKFVDLVGLFVQGRQHVDEGPDLVWIENYAIMLVFLIQVNELKYIWFPTFEYKTLRKHLVLTHICNFYLKDKLIVSQGYMLGNIEGQVSLKLVFFSLISRDLSFDKIDLGIL